MKRKHFFFLSICAMMTSTYADNSTPPNTNDNYIGINAYIQNPYNGLPSLGGNQTISESQTINHSPMKKLFTDGTYNVLGSVNYISTAGYPSTSFAANIFAQTGQVYGFSLGGVMTVANPGGALWTTPNVSQQTQFLPVQQVILPTELFAEYQYSNIMNVDIGRISINNSPWLTAAYSNQYTTPALTYQGGLVNVNPGGGWLLTALAFNQNLPVGQNTFSDLTLYNSTFDYGTNTRNILSEPTKGTLALGANYFADNNNYNLRMWGYQFENYANLAYADNSYKINVNKLLSFNVAAQGGYEQGTNNNIISNDSDGTINSTFFGAQASVNYDWFSLALAANTVFGPENSYLGGGIISPYTYQLASDPLYTTSYILGMVEKSGGNAYKITPTFTFQNGNISIAPSAAYYQTNPVADSFEYDLVTNYNVPSIKGLAIMMDAGYLIQGQYDINFTPDSSTKFTGGGNTYVIQFGINYLY